MCVKLFFVILAKLKYNVICGLKMIQPLTMHAVTKLGYKDSCLQKLTYKVAVEDYNWSQKVYILLQQVNMLQVTYNYCTAKVVGVNVVLVLCSVSNIWIMHSCHLNKFNNALAEFQTLKNKFKLNCETKIFRN